jgi:hypothetical protein
VVRGKKRLEDEECDRIHDRFRAFSGPGKRVQLGNFIPLEYSVIFDMLIYTGGDMDKAVRALDRPRHETLLAFYLLSAYNKFTE